MSPNDDTPLNLPTVRVWDIDENSTWYDKIIAAPTDEELKIMWIVWSSILVIVTVFHGIVFVAILLDKKARKNPFNVYLLCLMVPDIVTNFLCLVTCLLNAAAGHFYSEDMCLFQSFYYIFGIGANSWLNAVIARQLYQMLDSARHFRRYKPPPRNMVVLDALKVYAFAAFVAAWGVIDKPWWPHKTSLVLGTACIPVYYDTASTIFSFCVFFPALMGIPMGYVIFLCYRIKKHNLMPPMGKRRLLALYFFRLAAVYIIMWFPAIFIVFVFGPWLHHWASWAGGAWSHIQGLVSTALSLVKPDIYQATRKLVTCHYYGGGENEGRTHQSSSTTMFPSNPIGAGSSSRQFVIRSGRMIQGSNEDLSQHNEPSARNNFTVPIGEDEVEGIVGDHDQHHPVASKLGSNSVAFKVDEKLESDGRDVPNECTEP